jgi:hypothetical protein
MGKTIEVNDTLMVTAQTVCKPCVWIERDGGGLLKIGPDEVHPLIDALSKAADVVTKVVDQVASNVTTGGPDEHRH